MIKYNAEFTKGLQEFLLQLEGISASTLQFFKEALNLQDLGGGGVSGLAKKHMDIRLTDPRFHSDIHVIEVDWNIHSDELTAYFNAYPTKGEPTEVMTPTARQYSGTFYNVVFQFQGVNEVLGDWKTFMAKDETTRLANLRYIIWHCNVRLYSNDPSFYYQGYWEDLDKSGAALWKFPGPQGTNYWHDMHNASGGLKNPDVRVTKHQAQIISQMNELSTEMLSKLKNK